MSSPPPTQPSRPNGDAADAPAQAVPHGPYGAAALASADPSRSSRDLTALRDHSPTVTFRVATYNIRKSVGLDWRRRPDRVLTVLSEIEADVVALQEVDKRFGSRASTLSEAALGEAGWTAAHFPRTPLSLGWRGNAILLGPAVRIEKARGMELPAFEPRGIAIAEIRVNGQPVRIVGMHLGLTRGARLRQLATIVGHLEESETRPTVLMGDTNEWRTLTGALSVFGRGHRLSPPTPTFHAAFPVAALDRIITTVDLDFVRCGVHVSEAARRASDHLPLWADLAFTESS